MEKLKLMIRPIVYVEMAHAAWLMLSPVPFYRWCCLFSPCADRRARVAVSVRFIFECYHVPQNFFRPHNRAPRCGQMTRHLQVDILLPPEIGGSVCFNGPRQNAGCGDDEINWQNGTIAGNHFASISPPSTSKIPTPPPKSIRDRLLLLLQQHRRLITRLPSRSHKEPRLKIKLFGNATTTSTHVADVFFYVQHHQQPPKTCRSNPYRSSN